MLFYSIGHDRQPTRAQCIAKTTLSPHVSKAWLHNPTFQRPARCHASHLRNLIYAGASSGAAHIILTPFNDQHPCFITLQVPQPPEPPLVVDADSTRLEQIIWNLVNIALKFTPPKGRVELIASQVDGMARLDVIDSGAGLDQENLHKVFDLFSQADNQHTAQQREGLGIGLSLVRQLVEAHGGSVDVHSEGLAHGCRFTVLLPLCQALQITSGPTQSPAESGRLIGQKVLLAEDSRDVMEVLQVLLEMEAAHVEAFSDPLMALQAARDSSYDVIISDIGMSAMNGHELIQAIRQIAHLKYTPTIALTGYTTSNDEKKARLSGFDYHVSKPVSHDDFLDIIDEACHSRRY